MNIENRLNTLATALDQSNDAIYLMDTNQKFIYFNKRTLEMSGYRSEDSMLETQYFDMRCPAAIGAKNFTQEDQLVINKNRPIQFLGYYSYYGDEWVLLLGSKTPIYEKGKLTAVLSHFTPINNPRLLNLPVILPCENETKHNKFIQQTLNYTVMDRFEDHDLSERESECLFYLLRGYAARSVGELLGISPKTVEFHIAKIKIKMQCKTKSELIEKALHLGLGNILLDKVFNTLR